MIIRFLFYITIFINIYIVIYYSNKQKVLYSIKDKIQIQNTKYVDKLLYRNNNQNILKYNKYNIFDKLYILLIKTGVMDNNYMWWAIPQVVVILCFGIFFISFFIFKTILKLKFLTIIFCIPLGFLPIILLIIFSEIYEEKLEKNLISYIIQLKNQVRIDNDIINAFKNTCKYAQKPLNIYIKIFLFEINNGTSISQCFSNLKDKVNVSRFKQLINNLESCYMNGGNFYELLDKTQNVYLKIQKERNDRNEQTMSSRLVLIILIFMSIYVYFNFINSNIENYNIMINSVVGRIILYWSFISIWIMIFLIINIKKMDE